jgi:hypothetical protein
MRFVLEVDLAAGVVPDDLHGELGRILRYWAGNVKHYPLEVGAGETISDSSYAPVGSWRFADGPAGDDASAGPG